MIKASAGSVVVGLSSRCQLSRLAGFIAEEQGASVRYLHLLFSPKVNAVFGFEATGFDPEAWARSESKDFHRLDLIRESEAWLEAQALRCLGQFWAPDLRGLFDSEFLVPRLLAWARAHKIENVSTGHRARISAENEREFSLWRSRDLEHDQSSWLAQAGRRHFSRLSLPLGYLKLAEIERLCQQHDIARAGERLADESSRLMDFNVVGEKVNTRSLSRVKHKGFVIDESQRAVGEHAGLIGFHLGSPRENAIVVGCDLMKQWLVVGAPARFERVTTYLTGRAEWCTPSPRFMAVSENVEFQVGFSNAAEGKARLKLLVDSMTRLERVAPTEAFPFAGGRRVTLYRGALCLGSAQVLEWSP